MCKTALGNKRGTDPQACEAVSFTLTRGWGWGPRTVGESTFNIRRK